MMVLDVNCCNVSSEYKTGSPRAWIVEVFRRFVHLQFSYDSLMIMIYLGRFQIIMGNDIPCYDSLIIMIYLGWSQIIMGNDILWSMFVGIRQHANFQAI